MQKNVGGIDRNIRLGLGSALMVIGILAPLEMSWRIGLLVVAAVALGTAFAGL